MATTTATYEVNPDRTSCDYGSHGQMDGANERTEAVGGGHAVRTHHVHRHEAGQQSETSTGDKQMARADERLRPSCDGVCARAPRPVVAPVHHPKMQPPRQPIDPRRASLQAQDPSSQVLHSGCQ